MIKFLKQFEKFLNNDMDKIILNLTILEFFSNAFQMHWRLPEEFGIFDITIPEDFQIGF